MGIINSINLLFPKASGDSSTTPLQAATSGRAEHAAMDDGGASLCNSRVSKNAQPYIYTPLRTKSTIRLVKILPEKKAGKVVGTIFHFEEAEAPRYHALSYLWGDATPAGAIYLGDTAADTYLRPLHANLLSFLDSMWEQTRFDIFLWIDSLCLNQEDVQEKSQQVPRMGRIYANAGEALIWLGQDSAGEEMLRTLQNGRYSKEAGSFILRLPYWTRVWIIQEVVIPTFALVVYGRASIDFETLFTQMAFYKWQPGNSFFFFNIGELRKRGGKISLAQLVSNFPSSSSTRDIDKIYGLLGLAEESENGPSVAELIGVNYEKSLYEVMWDTIFECSEAWDQHWDVAYGMRRLLEDRNKSWLNEDITILEDYVQNPRTSDRHALFGEIALRACALATSLKYNEEEFWTNAIDEYGTSERHKPSGNYTELQNAAAIGLGLTRFAELTHSTWLSSLSRRLILCSEWKVKTQRSPGLYVEQLTTPVPTSISQAYLESFNTKKIAFKMQLDSAQLAVELDTEQGLSHCWALKIVVN